MASLQKDLHSSRRSAYAEGTVKNLRIQWEAYLSFCLYFGLSYLPADTNILCLYAQCLCRTFKSTQSIRNYLSGIKTMHYILGYPTDNINNFLLYLSLKGIARLKPHCVQQALPITPDMLVQMYSFMDFSDPNDLVYWCLFLFAFYLFARKSNLVPTTKKDLKSKKLFTQKECFKRRKLPFSNHELVKNHSVWGENSSDSFNSNSRLYFMPSKCF